MTTPHNNAVRQALSDALAAAAAAAHDDDQYLRVAAHILEAYKAVTAIQPPPPFLGER
jgi:hypothetical protein